LNESFSICYEVSICGTYISNSIPLGIFINGHMFNVLFELCRFLWTLSFFAKDTQEKRNKKKKFFKNEEVTGWY